MNADSQKRWLDLHTFYFTVITAIAFLPLYFLCRDTNLQIDLLVVNIAILGICHGSFDHLKFCLNNDGRLNLLRMVAFVAAYLLIASLVLYVWLHDPSAMLIAFLIISFIHFAMNENNDVNLLEKIIWSSLPIFSPCFFHSKDVMQLFSILTGEQISFSSQFGSVLQVIGFLIFGLACSSVLIGFLNGFERRNKERLISQTANTIFLISYFFLPPLVSFTLYFCWWHSARECIRIISELSPVNFLTGLSLFIKSAAPMTLGSWVLGVLIFIWLGHSAFDLSERQIATIFFLLSSLTVPHMFVSMIFPTKLKRISSV